MINASTVGRHIKALPRWAWVALGLALVVRAIALASIWSLPPAFDASLYHDTAFSLANGDGLLETTWPPGEASAIHPPGYPLVLAALYVVFGANFHLGQLLGAVLGVASVGLIGLITWQLFRNRIAALIAMTIAAVYPPLVIMSVTLMSEAVFIPLALGGVAAALHQRDKEGWKWSALAGALIGAAMYMRLAGAVFLIMLALTVWRPTPGRFTWRAIRAPAVMLLVGALLWAPWSIRNSIAMDKFIPMSTQTGTMFAGTYNDETRKDPLHEWRSPAFIEPYASILERPDIQTEAEMSSELSEAGWRYIEDHPTFPFTVAWSNIKRVIEVPRTPSLFDSELMGLAPTVNESTRVKLIFWACQAGFLILAALSLRSLIRGAWRRIPVPLLLTPLLVLGSTIFFAAGMRYRLPGDFLVIALAAVSLATTRVGGWFDAHSESSAAPAPKAKAPAPATATATDSGYRRQSGV